LGYKRFLTTAVPQTLVLTPKWYNSPHISAVLIEQYMQHKINCYMQPYYTVSLFNPYPANMENKVSS